MNTKNCFFYTLTLTKEVRKPRSFATLPLRYLRARPRRKITGKERDPETGLYYYGARYLDPKASRWLSGDPAVAEYIPSAPVNEEARKRNGNLPGMGGVFNYVNLHVYHYAGNNPVKLVDPDGWFNRFHVFAIGAVIGGIAVAAIAVATAPLTSGASFAAAVVVDASFALAVTLWTAGYIEDNVSYIGRYNNNQQRQGQSLANRAQAAAPSPSQPPQHDNGGQDNIPELITNNRHHPNSRSPEPRNVNELYQNSVRANNGTRWAKDSDGNLHRFSSPSNGQKHWNGSTIGTDPIRPNNIPIEIKRFYGITD